MSVREIFRLCWGKAPATLAVGISCGVVTTVPSVLIGLIVIKSFEIASYLKGNVKGKRTVLSVKDELQVHDTVKRKISKTDIMLQYNISRSNVNDTKQKTLKKLQDGKM